MLCVFFTGDKNGTTATKELFRIEDTSFRNNEFHGDLPTPRNLLFSTSNVVDPAVHGNGILYIVPQLAKPVSRGDFDEILLLTVRQYLV